MPNRLASYIDSIRARDPAPHSRLEILTYPGVWALADIASRIVCTRRVLPAGADRQPLDPRLDRDRHPSGREDRRNFFIDHGFVVIGETAEIGDDVTIYQCVTLGGTSPDNGVAGKRHPTVMNGAIIGSGAQVLGPITLGPRSRVGANAVVTRDVPEGAVMVGIPARPTMVEGGQQTPRFVPYGTPCSENFDPVTQRTELLRCEVEQLRRRLDALLADQQGEGERDRGLMGVVPFPLNGAGRSASNGPN